MVQPENLDAEYTSVPKNKNLDEIFSIKEYRKIRLDHTFSYGNKLYLIKEKIGYSIVGQKVQILIRGEWGFKVFFNGKEVEVSEAILPNKWTMEDWKTQKKIDAVELAKSLGSISEASKRSGFSRDSIYRFKRILQEEGREGLKPLCKKIPNLKNRIPKNLEQKVISFSLKNPHLGQVEVSKHLKKKNIHVVPSTICSIWGRHQMRTIALRIQKDRQAQKVAV